MKANFKIVGASRFDSKIEKRDVSRTMSGQTPAFIVGEVGPNQRMWQNIISKTNGLGQTITKTNQAYVEVATGLNYWDPVGRQWIESKDEIQSFPNGAAATKGQHQVIFANNLDSSVAIDMQTPDGKRLQSHVLGLSYFDTASGGNVWIAQITNCQGVSGWVRASVSGEH